MKTFRDIPWTSAQVMWVKPSERTWHKLIDQNAWVFVCAVGS